MGMSIDEQLVLPSITGVAPKTKLVSLKVLDEDGKGTVGDVIAAIAHIQEINGYARAASVFTEPPLLTVSSTSKRILWLVA